MKAASCVRRALPAPLAGAPIVAALLVLSGHAAGGPQDLRWLNPVTGPWEMGSNWTGGQTPNAPAFNAIIDATDIPLTPYVVQYNSNFIINNFSITPAQASMTLSAGSSLTMQGTYTQGANIVTGVAGVGGSALDIQGDATLTGSALIGFNEITARDSLTLTGTNVTMMWVNNFNSLADFRINVTGSFLLCDVDLGHGGNGASLLDWGPNAGQILLGMGSTFTNESDSTFTINNASTMGLIPGMGTGEFINHGAMVKASAGVTDINDVTFTNTAATGSVRVEAGTLRADTVTNYAAGSQTLTGGKWTVLDNATLDFATQTVQVNKAEITLSGAGSAFAALTDNLNLNDTGGKLTIDTGRNLTTAGVFGNKGTVTVGAGSTFAVAPGQAFTSFNPGAGALTEGVYDLKGRFKFTGANVVNLNADVTLDGAGAGMVNQSDANALLQSATQTNVIGATGALTVKNGANFITGGDLNVLAGGSLTVDTGTTFRVKPGSSLLNITPAGQFNNAGITVRGTLQADNADVSTVGAGADVILDGASSQIINGSGVSAFAALSTVDNGTFGIRSGRALTITNPVTPFMLKGASGKVVVGPRGNIDGPDGVQSVLTTTGDFSMENGELRIDDSVLRIEGAGGLTQTGGTINLLNGGTIELATPGAPLLANGSVAGVGTISGDATFGGPITPGAITPLLTTGALTVSGDAKILPTASLVIEFSAQGAWDSLVVGGALRFGDTSTPAGSLEVVVASGFIASLGSMFEVISAGSLEGEFATHGGAMFGAGLSFAPVYEGGSLFLQVVPAPGAAWVMGLALASAARRRR